MISVTAEQGNAGAAFASGYTNPRERQHTGAFDLNPIVEDAADAESVLSAWTR